MVFKTGKKITRTVEEDEVIKPSQIYKRSSAKENIQKYLQDWEITDFRPPLPGETRISDIGEVTTTSVEYSPRFIVIPRSSQSLSEVWE